MNSRVEDITVVMTAYRRAHALRLQLEAIRAQTVAPRQVWIWANDPDPAVSEALSAMNVDRIVTCRPNAYFHARFALALTAFTQYVAVFDDDSIPGPRWFENCVTTMYSHTGILGSAGVRLTGPSYSSRELCGWHAPTSEVVEADLVGHAWFLQTQWLHLLFTSHPVTGTNGEDIELSARAARLRGIRTYCPPHPPNDRSLWGSTQGEVLGSDAVASSRKTAHLTERDRIVAAEIAAGWQPMFARLRNAAASGESNRGCEEDSTSEPTKGPSLIAANAHSQAGATVNKPASVLAQMLLESIPASATRILLIGDDVGLTSVLRSRRSDSSTAVHVEHRLTCDEIPEIDPPFASSAPFPEPFDAVVCLALDQTGDQVGFLKRTRKLLRPNGRLIAVTPNVRDIQTVSAILEGRWAESAADDAPLRYFTRRELEKSLYRAGFLAVEIRALPGDAFHDWERKGRSSTVHVGNMRITTPRLNDAEEFFASAYIAIAQPKGVATVSAANGRPVSSPGKLVRVELTSIILVTHNQLPYTQMCLQSIRLRTDEPYELIVVDNGSTDATVSYLRTASDIHLILNADNRGFPTAVNQGIEAAKGRRVLLLNNDTIVTTGWLRRMIGVLDRDPGIGLVGPCTNHISGEQQVAVTYSDLSSLDGFAWEWGKDHADQLSETDRLVGFCLLIRREVIDRIGVLDERFGIGNFEDDDYCRRALAAGFRAVIARSSFIHHFGSRTFAASNINFAGLLKENRRKYDEKWGALSDAIDDASKAAPPVALQCPAENLVTTPEKSDSRSRDHRPFPRRPRSPFVIGVHSEGGLIFQANQIRLSACLIVRDNETTIGPALVSIRPWVDEIIVVDTGSRDRTPEICRTHGARVFEFPWCDDFSAARNVSLRHARGEWIVWMDSDDTISPTCGQQLRDLVHGNHAENVLGYVMQVHCPGSGDEGHLDTTVVDHVKLIRNRPDVYFEFRIHEQLLPSIRRAGGDVAWTNCHVVHSGSDHSETGKQRKIERDLRILNLELAERPAHPFVLFNLGMTLADIGRYDEAVRHLEKCVAVSQAEESHVRKAYALLVISLTQLGEHERADVVCRRASSLFPDDKELLFRAAMLHHHFGRLADAERTYLKVLGGDEKRHFSSIDRGLAGFKARHNLALVYSDMSRSDDAEAQWRRITEEVPDYTAGWRALADILIRAGKIRDADQLVRDLTSRNGTLHREGVLLRGRLAALRGQSESAASDYETADRADPRELEPLRLLCQLCFEEGKLDVAERHLCDLTRRAPNDAAAFHNLGMVQFQRNSFQQAAESYKRSVQLRPSAVTTRLQWGWSLKHANRISEAVAVWRELLDRFPGQSDAMRALSAVGPCETAGALG